MPVADLQPLRDLFPAFTAATGATAAQAVAAVCAKYGVAAMQGLSPEQAADAAEWMRGQIAAAADGAGEPQAAGAAKPVAATDGTAQPDMYDEDVDF